MTKRELVKIVLQRYGRTNRVNLKAWDYFMREAESDKAWAQSVTPEWFENACEVSRQMAWDYRITPTIIMAAQRYGYRQFRAGAVGKAWGTSVPIDRSSTELWQSFAE